MKVISIEEEEEEEPELCRQFAAQEDPSSVSILYRSHSRHTFITDHMKLQNTRYVIDSVTMGQVYIERSLTCDDNGIDDNARLKVNLRERFTFDKVVSDIKEINPDIDEVRLKEGFM